MEKISRPFTLGACIVQIVLAGSELLYLLDIITEMLETLTEISGITPTTIYYGIIILVTLLNIAIIILASQTIKRYKNPHQTYPRDLVITLFVINCILILGALTTVGNNYLSIISAIAYGLCGTFLMIDLVKNKQALNDMPQDQNATDNDPEPKPLAQKLQKLNAMKSAGLINDEDFEKLKAKLIEQADIEGI